MKTIEIQKSTKLVDRVTVIVNGEKHTMHQQSFKIQVVDNKPFEVKVGWGGNNSDVMQFDPKDNMVLQISKNWLQEKRNLILSSSVIFLASFIGVFFAKTILLRILFFLFIYVLFYVLGKKEFFNRKKVYTITEVNK
jgi:maltodextrin utilization protein YvdJ